MGAAGQGGTLFVRGTEDEVTLRIRRGDSEATPCRTNYQILPRAKDEDLDAVCFLMDRARKKAGMNILNLKPVVQSDPL